MKRLYLPIVLSLLLMLSCTRKEIEFGTIPENAYTQLSYVDTISAQLSTVLTDSFSTNSDTSFLLGRYKDSYLGSVTARPFFQLSVPESVPDIPASAVFDSLSLIFKPNKYYYGDTSRAQTFQVYELASPIAYTYNSQLFNTSSIPVRPAPLGSATLRVSPSVMDSVVVRLSDVKGKELFEKLRDKTTDVTTQEDFLNYFHGLSVSVADGDTSAVFGLKGTDTSFIMRVHYHLTIPYPEAAYVDFASLANEYAFQQILPERAGTGLVPVTAGLSELFPAATNNLSFLQQGSGLLLKMVFPTLKSILNKANDGTVKLLKAELVIKPKYLSSNQGTYMLPSSLGLAQTDATNQMGSLLTDSTGQATLYAAPYIDEVYGIDTHYRFTVTSYINTLLNTVNSEKSGLYIFQQSDYSWPMDRLVLNATAGQDAGVMLLLYVLNINN